METENTIALKERDSAQNEGAAAKEESALVVKGDGDDTADKTKKSNENHPERDHWSSDLDFILACVGLAVGLGNIWRFPYLCYKNGGGAFLIPYLICLFTSGIPVFLLELAVGQYMNIGSLEAWAGLVPAFKGIGMASFSVIFQLNLYYIVILAWAFYYLVMSFTSVLPWSHCQNEWNTEYCFASTATNMSTGNSSVGIGNNTGQKLNKTVDAVVEFWEYVVFFHCILVVLSISRDIYLIILIIVYVFVLFSNVLKKL